MWRREATDGFFSWAQCFVLAKAHNVHNRLSYVNNCDDQSYLHMILVNLASYITPTDIWHNWRTFSLYKKSIKGGCQKVVFVQLLVKIFSENVCVFLSSKPFITTLTSGKTKTRSTFQEARLGLTHKRLSYRPTGRPPSPTSVLVWSTANRPGSSSSTSRLTLCTHWSLTGNSAPPHWAVRNGSRWLGKRAPYSHTVTYKASML